MRYNFEWDPNKAGENRRKHKITFERAAQIFLDPFQISIFDEGHSEDEDRWVTLGKNSNDVLIVVVHIFREVSNEDCTIRIISARKANKRETKQYKGYRE